MAACVFSIVYTKAVLAKAGKTFAVFSSENFLTEELFQILKISPECFKPVATTIHSYQQDNNNNKTKTMKESFLGHCSLDTTVNITKFSESCARFVLANPTQ